MVEKFDKDTFTYTLHDPQVQLKATVSDGPDMNQLYDLDMTSF